MKITIQRALTELKTIDDRITKKIGALRPVALERDGQLLDKSDKALFESKALTDLQSLTDLVKRKNLLRGAINEANTVTKVNVLGTKITIAQAIIMKDEVTQLELINRHLRSQYSIVSGNLISMNATTDKNALNLVTAALGNDATRNSKEDILAITDPYLKKNTVTLVDPLGILEAISEKDEFIDNFRSDIDATLSEINATTFIEL